VTTLTYNDYVVDVCPIINVYQIPGRNGKIPTYGTSGSAAFDFYADLKNDCVTVYSKFEQPGGVRRTSNYTLELFRGERYLIPTGLILSIPDNHVLLIYPRSSLALKRGISLTNCVGVVDSDYVEELFIMVSAMEDTKITHGERIAQGILMPVSHVHFSTIENRPVRTTREGGFGSTGTH
jgi:dUTP pyrophosphatase